MLKPLTSPRVVGSSWQEWKPASYLPSKSIGPKIAQCPLWISGHPQWPEFWETLSPQMLEDSCQSQNLNGF